MTQTRFGYCLPIFASPGNVLFRTPNYATLDAATTMALGRHAEELGFHSLWVADHLMLGKDEAILEGWTTLSALGGSTSRIRLGLIHQAHYFRPPSIAAKMAATLDQITGGRYIHFYDFGRQPRESLAYGLPYPDAIEARVEETVDGIRLIKDLWSATTPITAAYGSYAVVDATCTPTPVQQPHPPIWFGEPDAGLLAVCAELGQGWNTTPVSVAEFERRLGLLRDACATAGTPYDAIEKSVEIQVLISPEPGARALLKQILARSAAAPDAELLAYANGDLDQPPERLANTTLIGSPDEVIAQLSAYIDAGADHVLLWFLDAPDRSGMELFVREVMPRLHDR
jgi:alkanesulfonate monooxygenase SsuD/methylene tetrahydromethanopterin reductase-like flavin-dependent oxidoreductase (luciferase family)